MQSFPRRHDLIVWIRFANLSCGWPRAIGVDGVDRKITGAVEVEIGIERVGVEIIDGRRIFLWNMAVAHGFADDRAVLAFSQCVIVGLAWP